MREFIKPAVKVKFTSNIRKFLKGVGVNPNNFHEVVHITLKGDLKFARYPAIEDTLYIKNNSGIVIDIYFSRVEQVKSYLSNNSS